LPHDANSNYGTAINQWRGKVRETNREGCSPSSDAGIRPLAVELDSNIDFRCNGDCGPLASAQGQLAWIVRKVSEVDITESDRRLGACRGGSAGMAGMERIVGRLDVATTCDDDASAAIPIWSIFVATSV
jgi:hypothetical protein